VTIVFRIIIFIEIDSQSIFQVRLVESQLFDEVAHKYAGHNDIILGAFLSLIGVTTLDEVLELGYQLTGPGDKQIPLNQ
jgi:hypothetical protein